MKDLKEQSGEQNYLLKNGGLRKTKRLFRSFPALSLPLSPVSVSVICTMLVVNVPALAQGDNASEAAPLNPHKIHHSKSKKVAHKGIQQSSPDRLAHATNTLPLESAVSGAKQLSAEDRAIAAARATSLARLDKLYGEKGWDIPYPSYEDTLLQDYGGFRTALASLGFGFQMQSANIFSQNTLKTPIKVPAHSASGIPYPPCSSTSSNSICAGKQVYFGERTALNSITDPVLTYDTSRWGVPDGQIQIIGVYASHGDPGYTPNSFQMMGLSWYQTLFNKAVEIKLGYIANELEWVGTSLSGNVASSFGASASIPVELGQSVSPTTAPTARFTWHITDRVYNEFGAQRSLPVHGPTGNAFLDETTLNPTGFTFSRDGEGVLFMNEFGYKNSPAPNDPGTWARFGTMYNTSAFTDYSKLLTNPNATIQGNSAVYFLVDRQLWQQAPGSIFTSYRGPYAGMSAMYAPPKETPFSQYYNARVFWIGMFDSRPIDVLSATYEHNVISRYIPDQLNAATSTAFNAGFPVPMAVHATNSYTIAYLVHIMPGIYAQVGLSYTQHPSLNYFKGEGNALNFLASTFLIF